LLKILTRLLLIVFVFAALYAGMSRAIAASADEEGRSLARWFILEARRSEALRQRAAEMAQALEIKKAIAEDVVAGRLTLRDAAKQFRAAGAIVQADREGLVAAYYLPDTYEGVCRQVVAWAQTVIRERHPASEAEPILHRLEKEMDKEFPSAKILN
jgi:hypothetical protein